MPSASFTISGPYSLPPDAQVTAAAQGTHARDYREYARNLSPQGLAGYLGRRLMGTFGLMFDVLAEATREAILARTPGSETFPEDAVARVGAGRALPRYPTESAADYALRIEDAWTTWRKAGTDMGLIDELARFGFTATIETPRTWNWDNDAANWSRVWVVISVHPWTGARGWGTSLWNGGTTWGSTASAEEGRALRAIVRKMLPANVKLEHIIVVMNAVTWAAEQPNGTWDLWINRSRAARYF
jgi:hypothetical protein